MASGVYTTTGIFRLEQIGEKVVKGVSDVMQDYAEKIVERAREYAPIDKGNLERAIKKSTNKFGLNRRNTIDIYVDETMSVGKGKTIRDYARYMHEGIPGIQGGYKLGKKSLEKDAGRGIVGRKYLTRALNDYKQDYLSAVRSRADRVLGPHGRNSTIGQLRRIA